MLGWLYRKIIGNFYFCKHEWEIIKEIDVYEDGNYPIYQKILLQCNKCGDLKKHKI